MGIVVVTSLEVGAGLASRPLMAMLTRLLQGHLAICFDANQVRQDIIYPEGPMQQQNRYQRQRPATALADGSAEHDENPGEAPVV